MNKKISIIIPVYNVEKYIKECLETVINQSYNNIEIIIVIDGSNDNSINIVERMAKNDNRIILLKQSNQGVILARVNGLKVATGDFIMFLDADDYLDYNACMKLLEYQEKYNVDIVKCSYMYKDKNEIKKQICKNSCYICKMKYENMIYKPLIENSNLNSIWGQLIKRDLALASIQKNNKLRFAEDLDYNLRLYTNSQSIFLTDDILYYYRVNSESVTNDIYYEKIKNILLDTIFVYSQFYSYIKLWNMDNEINRRNVSLRLLKEITDVILHCYRVENLNSKSIDEIIKTLFDSDELNRIRENLLRKEIKFSKSNKHFVMKAIYDRKKWKIKLYGTLILYPYKKLIINKERNS